MLTEKTLSEVSSAPVVSEVTPTVTQTWWVEVFQTVLFSQILFENVKSFRKPEFSLKARRTLLTVRVVTL